MIDISSLSASSDWWEGIEELAAIIVIVGVVGEGIADWPPRWIKSRIDIKRMSKTAWAILVAGLALELVAVINKSVADAKVIAALHTEARNAELAIEKLKTPRTLDPRRQRLIADAVKPFTGQRYMVSISAAADDGPAFWESLYATLEKGGWTYMPASGLAIGRPPAHIPVTAIPGVEILVDPSKETERMPAALALGNALREDGSIVAVNRDFLSNPNESDRDILQIRIGARVPRE